MQTAYHYVIYGLNIIANQPIYGVTADVNPQGQPDLRIWVGRTPPNLPLDSPEWQPHRHIISKREYDQGQEPILRIMEARDGDYILLHYANDQRFAIDRHAENVWLQPRNEDERQIAAPFLLGPILGFVLRLRGYVVMHGSAIEVNGRAIIISGPSGAGKSTTAAYFVRRGHNILADDLAVFAATKPEHQHNVKDSTATSYRVLPGYPRLRLRPASIAAVVQPSQQLQPIAPTINKQYLLLDEQQGQFQSQALTCQAFFFLPWRAKPHLSPQAQKIEPMNALITMVGNTYMNYLLDSGMRAAEFQVLSRLVHQIPAYRLRSPHGLENLPHLYRTILDTLTAEN